MSRAYLTNIDTGEIITELREGDRILRKESQEKLSNIVSINKDKQYVKVYTESFEQMMQEEGLSGADLTVLFAMLPYVRYESGLVAYNNGNFLSTKAIARLSKLSERHAYRSIEILVQKRIIAKVRAGKDVKYFVNPYIFMRGRQINKTLEAMFRTSKYAN